MRALFINFREERPRLFNCLLALLVLLTGGLAWNIFSSSSQNIVSSTENYDAFATDITSIKFSSQGVKQYELFSPRLNHYNSNDQTYIDTPKLYMYTHQQEGWLVTSQYALASHGTSTVNFINDVNLSGEHTQNHKNTQLLTEKITYFPDNNIAKTPLPVTIIQPGSIIHATGMEVAFNTGTISLLSHINGSYDPNVHS